MMLLDVKKIILFWTLFFVIPIFSASALELPRVSQVIVKNITKDSAEVNWETNHFQYICTVYYGTSPMSFDAREQGVLTGSGAVSPKGDLVVPYKGGLTGLLPNQIYFYKIVCTNSEGGSQESGIQSFTTLGETPLSINNLSISSITDQSTLVSWEVSETPSKCEVLYGVNVQNLSERAPAESSSLLSWKASLLGLTPDTKYFYKVSCDRDNRSTAESSIQEFSTRDIALQISNITETNINSSSAVIRWETNSPNSECVLSYGIGSLDNQVSGSLVRYGDVSRNSPSVFEAILSRLLPDTVYSYVVSCSGKSDTIKSSQQRFSTLPNTTSKEPTVVQITTFRAYNIAEDSATINWDAGSPLYSCVLLYGDTPRLSLSALGRLVQYATTTNDGRNIYESQLRRLKQATKYYYKVNCSLDIGFSGESDLKEFTTLGNLFEKDEFKETKAGEIFQKIYLREPNPSNRFDNNAVSIIAYGIKQRAENRSLSKEFRALTIYVTIFRALPSLSEEWNVLHAIAYSGAKR